MWIILNIVWIGSIYSDLINQLIFAFVKKILIFFNLNMANMYKTYTRDSTHLKGQFIF